jgi:DNA-binding NarL/FixJ family response regulator
MATLSQQIEHLQPDVVLLELTLQDEESVLPLLALSAEPYETPIVILADESYSDWLADVLRYSVRAVLSREVTAGEIVAAVEAVAAGLVVLQPEIIESLLSAIPPTTRVMPTSPNQALTPREIEVLGMLAEGLGNKTIARRLGISEHTVKFHVSSIFTKLNASSRTEAVTSGARQGLIML